MDITSAIGILANQGVRAEPYAIERIEDSTGRIIYKHQSLQTDVLNRATVDTMVSMMLRVVQNGTGVAANIGRPVAGKTGTSDDHRDAWFVGFTPDYVTGVWVGNDDNTPMKSITGGSLPAQIWNTYMRAYLANRMISNFDLAYAKPLTGKSDRDVDSGVSLDAEQPAPGFEEMPPSDGEAVIQDGTAPPQGEQPPAGNSTPVDGASLQGAPQLDNTMTGPRRPSQGGEAPGLRGPATPPPAPTPPAPAPMPPAYRQPGGPVPPGQERRYQPGMDQGM
jgi:penicillin-binding protein 1A